MKEIRLKMKDGVEIVASLWEKVASPKGVVQICHGMSEYGLRYTEFARFLNSKGYIVLADDHRAHGRTESDKNRGRHKGDIFQKTLSDLLEIYNILKTTYKLPIYFLGHSYGSFLGQAFLTSGTDVKAVALLGTAYFNRGLALAATIALTPIELLFSSYRPSFVNKMSDILFNGRYKGDTGRSQWLTRDKQKRQEFIDDPLCGINMSINFDYYMIRNLISVNKKANLYKLNLDTPIGIFCGTDDPIGGYGKKATNLYNLYKKTGVKHLDIKLYEGGRHEMLNETNRQTVYKDILTFFTNAG